MLVRDAHAATGATPPANLALRAPLLSALRAVPIHSRSLLHPRAQTEPSPSSAPQLAAPATPRHRASIRPAPSRSTSPFTSYAPPRARLSPTPAESSPPQPATIVAFTGAPPPPSIPYLRSTSARFEGTVSILALSSPFPTLSPLESRIAGVGPPPRCRERPSAATVPSRAASAWAPAAPPCAQGPLGLLECCASHPRGRLAPPRLERRHHLAPPRAAAAAMLK